MAGQMGQESWFIRSKAGNTCYIIMLLYCGLPQGIYDGVNVLLHLVPEYSCELPHGEPQRKQADCGERLDHCHITVNNSDALSTCTQFKFDDSEFTSTIATKFNMVCENKDLPTYITMLVFVGSCVGNCISGYFGDSRGRRMTSLVALSITTILSILLPFATNWVTYAVYRFVMNACSRIAFANMFVMTSEVSSSIISDKQRSRITMTYACMWSFGTGLIATIGYFQPFRHSDNVIWALTALSIPALIFLYIMPESPVWVASQRDAELEPVATISIDVRSINARHDSLDIETGSENNNLLENGKDTSASIIADLLKSSYHMLVIFGFVSICTIHYGTVLFFFVLDDSSNGVSLHMSKLLLGLSDIPATFAVGIFAERAGRKSLLIFLSAICTASLFMAAFVFPTAESTNCVNDAADDIHHHHDPLAQQNVWAGYGRITCLMAGRFSVTAAWNLIWLYSTELFATPVRSTLTGFTQFAGAFGTVLSKPILNLNRFMATLPIITCGCLITINFLMISYLPETKGRTLFNTMDEATTFYKRHAGYCKSKTDTVKQEKQQEMAEDVKLKSFDEHK